MLHPAHESISANVIESIGIKLARNNGSIDVRWSISRKQSSNVLPKISSVPFQNGPHLGIAQNNFRRPILMTPFYFELCRSVFESMTEWPMSEIVHERGRHGDSSAINVKCFAKPLLN